MDKPAHNKGNIGATTDPSWPLIVRANPDYWNKSLPRSAVQLLSFTLSTDRKYLKNRRDEALQNNSISCHVYRVEESLDMETVKSLLTTIRK